MTCTLKGHTKMSTIKILSLICIIGVCLFGCNTKAPQFGVTQSELSDVLQDYDETDLYTAVSLAQLAYDLTAIKIFVLERLESGNPGYEEQMKYLQDQYTRRQQYLETLYKKVGK